MSRCFDPDPKKSWLFAFTHPDDELAIAAWVRRLALQGNPVFLSWTHSTPRREAEARAFAEAVQVPPDRLFFAKAKDGQCPEEMPQLVLYFRDVLDRIQPNRVATGAFEHGHLDHDATNCALHRAGASQVVEFPLYHSYLTRFQKLNRFSDPAGQEILELTQDEQVWKIERARGYPSQTIWSILVAVEIWHRIQFSGGQLQKTERLRWQTHRDFSIPNAPDVLRQKIKRSNRWQRWLSALDHLRQSQS